MLPSHAIVLKTLIKHASSACLRAEHGLMQEAYVPILYRDLISDPGPIGHLPKPRAARRGRLQRPFTPTSPRPMAFELRAQSRPKTIMQVGAAHIVHF